VIREPVLALSAQTLFFTMFGIEYVLEFGGVLVKETKQASVEVQGLFRACHGDVQRVMSVFGRPIKVVV
jgi:hypothetical protein